MKSKPLFLAVMCSGLLACGPEVSGVDTRDGVPDVDLPALLANAAPSEIRELPPFPFWARGPGCCLNGWGAVSFYVADPQQIPDDFNFIAFFDPRALSAEFAVTGFGIFKNPASPEMTNLEGLGAVPMWFFRPAAIAAMAADGVITRPEMEAHNPVKGHARQFREVFAPLTATSTQARHILVARGSLDSGGTFRTNWVNKLNENTGERSLTGHLVVLPN